MGRRPRSEGTLVSVAASSAFLARNFRVRCAIRANASTQSGSARLVQGPGTLRSAPALRPVTRSAIGVCQPEMITNRPSAERGLGLIRRHSAERSRADQRGRDGGEPLSGKTRGLGEAATQAQDREFAALTFLGDGAAEQQARIGEARSQLSPHGVIERGGQGVPRLVGQMRRRVACNAAAARTHFSSSAFRSGMGGCPFAHPQLQPVREQKRRHAPPGEHAAQPSHQRADLHRFVVTERGLRRRIPAASRRPRPP